MFFGPNEFGTYRFGIGGKEEEEDTTGIDELSDTVEGAPNVGSVRLGALRHARMAHCK